MSITCDICGGPLVIEVGGQYATCQVCGIKHSIARVREKAQQLLNAGIPEAPKKEEPPMPAPSEEPVVAQAPPEEPPKESPKEPPAQSTAQTILDIAGRFLTARRKGAGEAELEPLVNDLEAQYTAALDDLEQRLENDPAFHGVLGIAAHVLTIYYVEYYYVREDAEKYALPARAHLDAFLKTSGDTLTNEQLSSIKSAYIRSCEYTAYLAYCEKRYREVVPLLKDIAMTPICMGLAGASLSIIADLDDDPNTARIALSILERMDGAVKEPAANDFEEDVYRSAYTYYAMMLATNATRYPSAGFVPEIDKAVKSLRKCIGLIKDETYISWLQEYIDQYLAIPSPQKNDSTVYDAEWTSISEKKRLM